MILAETALYYYRARTYDPKTGRFLQQDPLPPMPGSMNPFLYVSNNPINSVDPSGLVTILVTTYNGAGVGTHSGLYITRDGNRFLYDPAGSCQSQTRGSGGFIEGDEANIGDYINYHHNGGSDVDVTVLNTTPEQEQQIMDRAME